MTDILILAALREEIAKLRPINRATAVVTGDGPVRAARGAVQAIERVRPRLVIGIGIAGAISSDLRRGDLIVGRAIINPDDGRIECDRELVDTANALGAKAATIVTSPTVATSTRKQQLAESIDGTAAVDLESAVWHRAATERGLPFVSIRCILDAAAEDLPEIVRRSIRADGSVSRPGVIARALIRPAEIATLAALRRRTADSASSLARFLVPFIEQIRGR